MSSEKEKFFARTMHTPDTPERAALRDSLRIVSKALLPLHRALINAAREDYAFAYEPVSPTQLLGLLGDDPFFAWLKPVTAAIVDIDEMARRDFERPDADGILARIDRLFGPAPEEAFAEHYIPILQRDVDVAIGHAAVRQAIGKVPPKAR
jgi:hypothetical protein